MSNDKHFSAAPALGVAVGSAWTQSGGVMAEADKLEQLIQLRLERPGETRENALKWALEMKRVYTPKACVHGISENRVCLSCSPWRRMWQ